MWNITRKPCEPSVTYAIVRCSNLSVCTTPSNAKLHCPSLKKPYLHGVSQSTNSPENYLGRCLFFPVGETDPQGLHPPSSVWCRHGFRDRMQLLYFDISAKDKIKYETSKLQVEINAIFLSFWRALSLLKHNTFSPRQNPQVTITKSHVFGEHAPQTLSLGTWLSIGCSSISYLIMQILL